MTTKRKRSARKAPSAKKGSYYDRMIVQPAARLIAAVLKKAKTSRRASQPSVAPRSR